MGSLAQTLEQSFASIRMAQQMFERSAEARLRESLSRLRVRDPQSRRKHPLEAALDAAMHVALAPMGSVHLADSRGECLTLAAQFGFDRRYVEHFARIEGPSCPCGWAYRHRQRIVVPDIGHSPLFYGERDLQIALAAGVRAVHATPLIDLRSRFLGVLTVHFRQLHTPSPGDLTRMDTLALIVASEIRRQ